MRELLMLSAWVVERVVIGDETREASGRAMRESVLYASEAMRGGVNTPHSIEAQSLKL